MEICFVKVLRFTVGCVFGGGGFIPHRIIPFCFLMWNISTFQSQLIQNSMKMFTFLTFSVFCTFLCGLNKQQTTKNGKQKQF